MNFLGSYQTYFNLSNLDNLLQLVSKSFFAGRHEKGKRLWRYKVFFYEEVSGRQMTKETGREEAMKNLNKKRRSTMNSLHRFKLLKSLINFTILGRLKFVKFKWKDFIGNLSLKAF